MTLYRNAPLYFSAMMLVVVAGFWKTYFSIFPSVTTTFHVHGVLMIVWVLVLISQPWFIRTGNYRWHRLVGKASYVLVPLIVWLGLIAMQNSMLKGDDGITSGKLQGLTLQIGGLSLFALNYALAIYDRKEPQLHARFMATTALAIIAAATIRIFIVWLPGFEALAPAGHAGFILTELMTVALILNDWRLGRVWAPYPVFLILFGINHFLFEYAAGMAWWQALAAHISQWPNLAPW